ncbi:MAG TPA: DUF4159 domain-containing protein [Gemmatimonadales bacterium]|nr:DUF4159 domain-containing protein [Gemmatimonadales bacterium]
MKRFGPALALALLLAVPLWLLAQRGGCNGCEALDAPPNPKYDGRFTYARIKYTMPMGEFGGRFRDIKWGHDYPRADFHFPKIIQEITSVRTRTDASVIVALDDPELMKFPFAYLCEPGFWAPSDKEAAGLRAYLLKGGFLIIDDFAGSHWYNFEAQMKRVLPEARFIPLTADHPIFDSFYRIPDLDFNHPYYGMKAQFFGIFEDNDPAKRMMAIVNYDYDVSEYWEFSDEGLFPIDLSNTAYKLGVNYLIYAFSH